MNKSNKGIDVEALKKQAAGRWPEILLILGGISADILDGKHHPCPRCGGIDRFRMIDQEAGALFCNQCFAEKNGDGIAALQWLTGQDYKTVINKLSEFLGKSSANGSGSKKSKPKITKPVCTDKALVSYYIRTLSKQYGKGVALAGKWKYNDDFYVLRFNLPTPDGEKQRKEFRPAVKVGNGWIAGFPDSPRPLYRKKEIIDATDIALVTVHGGEKATDAAATLGLLATTNAGGEAAINKTDWTPLARYVMVVIIIDNDPAGEKFGQAVAAILKKQNPDQVVKIIRLPNLPAKGDIVEWTAAGGTKEEFLKLVDAAPVVTAEQIAEWSTDKSTKDKSGTPTIVIGTDEKRVVDQAIAAMATHDGIYQRGGGLVHIVTDLQPPRGIARPKNAPRISNMPLPRLREILAESATWQKITDDGPENIHPPEWATKEVAARGQWAGIRRLENIVESPVLRADGSVLQTAGYDPLTGLILSSDVSFPPITDKPSKADAEQARDLLLELVSDFPFKDDIHSAAWLATVFTPFARYAIDGPAPLFFIDANVRGCGKSLLADATGIIATGRPMPRMTVPRDDEEIRKRITAVAISGEQIILLDNVSGNFGSQSLDAALTARTWSDRILGSSEMASNLPLYVTWFATGNNVQLQADTARRVCHIRLESPEENPEEREGFAHADLLAYVRAERPSLAAAAVTILAAYWQADRPDMKGKPWGSYESWSALVRSAVVWVGLPDPGETRMELRTQSDREAVALNQLLTGWSEIDPAGRGLTVVQALRIINDFPSDYELLRSALWELCPPKDGKTLNPRSIGMKLHHLRHRVMGGRCFDRRDSDRGAVWMVIKPDTTDTTDTSHNLRTRAGAHAHTRETPETAKNSVITPCSVRVQESCQHANVTETPTADGYINRQCRDCGEWLHCRKAKEQIT
ncbi:MAG: primase-helicase zinc-binding domain-containing protein [Thermoguttaceae bacterium]